MSLKSDLERIMAMTPEERSKGHVVSQTVSAPVDMSDGMTLTELFQQPVNWDAEKYASALRRILREETEYPNATVKRIMKIARGALE